MPEVFVCDLLAADLYWGEQRHVEGGDQGLVDRRGVGDPGEGVGVPVAGAGAVLDIEVEVGEDFEPALRHGVGILHRPDVLQGLVICPEEELAMLQVVLPFLAEVDDRAQFPLVGRVVLLGLRHAVGPVGDDAFLVILDLAEDAADALGVMRPVSVEDEGLGALEAGVSEDRGLE